MGWIFAVIVLALVVLLLRSKRRRFTVLFVRAENAFAARKWPEAEALYRQALAIAKERGNLTSNYGRHCQLALGRIRYRLGDLAEAESLLSGKC